MEAQEDGSMLRGEVSTLQEELAQLKAALATAEADHAGVESDLLAKQVAVAEALKEAEAQLTAEQSRTKMLSAESEKVADGWKDTQKQLTEMTTALAQREVGMHMRTRTRICFLSHSLSHTYRHTYAHARAHTHRHTHTHTLTHTHTHTRIGGAISGAGKGKQ
jgi:chromosome segregation ATPase